MDKRDILAGLKDVPWLPARVVDQVRHLAERGLLRAVGLGDATRLLARRGVRLAVGVSTEHAGLTEVPDAFAEARTARDGLAGAPGVLALPALTSFDYLVLRDDATALRLILLDNHVMRHLADLEAVHTFEGTETMQTLIVGRDITGISAFA